ncbi:hypothetical protein ElyMa_006389500, partial [Elysia marginata]
GNFLYEDKTHQLKPGDTVNYWLLTVSKTNGEGHTLTGQSFVFTGDDLERGRGRTLE